MLATFTVAAPNGPANPNDLGVLWPGAANQSWMAGTSRSDTIAAGQTLDESFVVTDPGVYGLQTQIAAGSAAVRILASDGSTVFDDDVSAGLNQLNFRLDVGAYTLQWTAADSGAVTIPWQLVALSYDYENFPTNGVGQTPAATVGFLAATPNGFGAASTVVALSPGAATAGNPTTTATETVSATLTPTMGAVVATGSPAPAVVTGLLMTPETGLEGCPTSTGWQTGAVGSLSDATAVALADAGHGLPAGLVSSSSFTGSDPLDGPAPAAAGLFTLASTERPAGAGRPESASARADALALALAQADPMIRFAGWFVERLPGGMATPVDAEAPAAGVDEDPGIAAAGPAIGSQPRFGGEPDPQPGRPRRPVRPPGGDGADLPVLAAGPQVVAAATLRPSRLAAAPRLRPRRPGRRPALTPGPGRPSCQRARAASGTRAPLRLPGSHAGAGPSASRTRPSAAIRPTRAMFA